MSRLNSFYLSPENWAEPYILKGEEAHHLLRVLRARPGETVRLFDGQGRDGLFTIESCTKSQATLSLQSITETPRPSGGVTLAVGWSKSARRGWLLEKAVELEADRIVFWQAARSQGKVPNDPKPNWLSQVISAAKQCENPWLPGIGTMPNGAQELTEFSRDFDDCLLLWEQEDASSLLDPSQLAGKKVLVVIGPEGGIDPGEAETLSSAGFRKASLGKRILRLETAALQTLGLFFHERQKISQ